MDRIFLSLKLMEFMAEHRSRENAVPRGKLLAHLQPYAPKKPDGTSGLDDRTLRELYIRQPVAACREGLFIPIRPEEVKEFYEYLLAKGMSKDRAWARVKIILTYYPWLWWGDADQKQGELFG